jgi:hypothetical protein
MAPRASFFVSSLIGAMCLFSITARAADIQIKKTSFGTGAEVGFGFVQYHNTHVWFRVIFVSDGFFKDIQEHRTSRGIEFRKKKEKKIYTDFPDRLVVVIEAHPLKLGTATVLTPPDYAAGLMEKPSFQLSWERGDETRPVVVQATEEHHHPLSFVWSYVLTVTTTAVPLTDSLAIDVSLRQGICRTHLTANLDSRKQRLIPSTCK